MPKKTTSSSTHRHRRCEVNTMAASHSTIPLPQPSLKTLSFPRGRENTGRIYLVLGFERILRALICPRHSWNWPRPLMGERHDGFDAHQTCFKCNTERFYNTSLLQPGPLYRVRAPEPESGSPRSWGKLLDFPAHPLGARLRSLTRWRSAARKTSPREPGA
jgi:hypothetical protein